jgi:signal transduction histidine kinase
VVLRPTYVTIAAAAVASAVTIGLALVPGPYFAYRSVGLHASLETAGAIIALIAATLVFGRFRETGRLNDLALVTALSVLAATNLFFAALPAALPAVFEPKFATWSAVIGGYLGSALLALAAIAPTARVRHPRSAVALTLFALFALLGIIAAIIAGLASELPAGIKPGFVSGELQLESHGAVFATQIAAAVLLGVAAIGFARKAAPGTDELLRWLAVAATLGAFARINFAVFPTLYSQWVSTGDILRLAFYAAILVGAEREIRAYQRRSAAVAVLEERRRIARDLHDGLAQELAFISAKTRHLGQHPTQTALVQIASAAERAMDESRRAIATLTRPLDEPFDVTLAATAEELSERLGAHLELDLARDIQLPAASREALLRIVREAMTNAGRHGHARSISLQLELVNDDRLQLRIVDDGIGFDLAEVEQQHGAFGLISMRERVQALGGEFHLLSKRGEGTSIEVVL